MTSAETWERERAFTALAGRLCCPRYAMPCWICKALHCFTGTVRSVTVGRFDRFEQGRIFAGRVLTDPALVDYDTLDFDCTCCPGASGDSYWSTEEASRLFTTTPVTPARTVSDGTSQTRTPEEPAERLHFLQALEG